MSLTGMLSANLHHLRNTLGNSGSFKLLRFQADGALGNVITVQRCRVQSISISTKAVGKSQEQGSKPRIINQKLLDGKDKPSAKLQSKIIEFQDIRNVQCYSPEQTITDSKITEWPAVLFAFDIETTGFSREERIIEVAFRDFLGGRNSTFQSLVNPEKEVKNSYIHGISTGMVRKPSVPRMKDLIPILLKYVASRQMLGKPVVFVAHNGRRFDIPFFIREFSRCSTEIPSDWLFLDTLPLARKLVKSDGTKLPSVSLQALREHYDIPLTGQAHRAMQDVTTLCHVLQKISFELKLSVTDLMEGTFRAPDITKGTP